MRKIEVLVGGIAGAKLIASDLIEASIWFEVYPYPFDNYLIQSREEVGARNAFATAAEFPPNPEIEEPEA